MSFYAICINIDFVFAMSVSDPLLKSLKSEIFSFICAAIVRKSENVS